MYMHAGLGLFTHTHPMHTCMLAVDVLTINTHPKMYRRLVIQVGLISQDDLVAPMALVEFAKKSLLCNKGSDPNRQSEQAAMSNDM